MRKWLTPLVGLAVGVAIPLAAYGASGASSSSLDQQSSRWTTDPITTTSRTFHVVPALSGTIICAEDQVTATLSVQGSDAPMGLQIRVDGGALMEPLAVRFSPNGSFDSTSFTFVIAVGTFEADDHHAFQVEWRSPTGAATSLLKGDLNLQYQTGTHGC